MSGKSPHDRAAELIRGTRLKEVSYRKQLADGGRAAVAGSADSLIELARLVDPPARELRRTYEERSRSHCDKLMPDWPQPGLLSPARMNIQTRQILCGLPLDR